MNSRHSRQRPHWWPENEAWPPAHGHPWHHRRRFMRRIGCLFALLLMLSVVGAVTLVSMLLGRGPADGSRLGVSLAIVLVPLAVVLFLALFAGAMRRFGFPLGDIVEASERVGQGDFTPRVI